MGTATLDLAEVLKAAGEDADDIVRIYSAGDCGAGGMEVLFVDGKGNAKRALINCDGDQQVVEIRDGWGVDW